MSVLRKNILVFVVASLIGVSSCSFSSNELDNPDKDKLLIDLISYVLERAHYNVKDFDDAFSESVYDDFILTLDPFKRYFLASDIKTFNTYRTEIDDLIKNKDLTFFNLTYERLMQRIEEAKQLYPEVLNTAFNYKIDEDIIVDYESLPYVNSKKELKNRWRKQLKFSAISNYFEDKEEQESEIEKNRKTKVQSDKALEEKARETTLTNMVEYYDIVADLERKDYFAMFLNSIVEEFDPHTNYFAPPDKDRFDTQMSGKFEGIGARLQKKNGRINVVEVISGGPAWRGEHLEVGDEIQKVRQEHEEEAVTVSGMRINDAVKLIKGPKGSKVILTLKRVDGTIEEETIIRDVVELEETYAKSVIINKEDKTFALINLPSFYFDMDDYDKRNAASDIKKEIIKLKQEGIEGLALDLRNNGGGSLRTAVDIAGLFIKDGPIVQVVSKGKRKKVLEDKDKNIIWDGPLVLLVNETSASASEILAAAMQDYKRAIIIGSKQTYGKGTVQTFVDLNGFLRNNEFGDMGALKVTIQKFYRVNGGSTQLEGVKSDVDLPGRYSYLDIGERDYDNPLPYDKISPAKYNPWDGYIDYEKTISDSKARIANSKQIKLIDQRAKWTKERRDDNIVSLNYKNYTADIENNKNIIKQFNTIRDYKTNLSFKSLPYEVNLMKEDTVLLKKRKRWLKNLSRDVYIEEAMNILEDLKLNNIRHSSLADIKN